ncbi:MAG: cellulase [Verrucomicrobia bacterium]|nr:cellulase [Verrucomicrobiota bacterium]
MGRTTKGLFVAGLLIGCCLDRLPAGTITVDAESNRHPIDPRIYGVAHADTASLKLLNAPLNRSGGNNTTRYNWKINCDNKGFDWYFESLERSSTNSAEMGDTFITNSRQASAEAMLTIPMIGWIAKLGPSRQRLCSFSIGKYGAQTDSDWQWFADAGNGILSSTGLEITSNDPNDASTPSDPTFQRGWVRHLTNRWGVAGSGGLKYYLLDNEHSIWHSTHRDVQKTGATMEDIRNKMLDFGGMVKSEDVNAIVAGPEEWGWSGYIWSGYDLQYCSKNGWGYQPDRAAHGNMDYMPWLLDQLRQTNALTGRRILDIFTLHIYPQGGEFSDDTSASMQSRRNRSTRCLWDPNYVDETWIGTQVKLIPRMKQWVASYYPGTQIGITEYNWGAESHINGATAQADIYGIFGREALDVGARWTTPGTSTPTFLSMKMYRNYDGNKSGFGDTSVSAAVANPDNVSAFASVRSSDNALTIMAINKMLGTNDSATIVITNYAVQATGQVWRLASGTAILRLADIAVSSNRITATLPAQSITLFVLPFEPDANRDGLPDAWQKTFFGGTTNQACAPDADPDHDGANNRAEYIAGTCPTNVVDSLKLAAPAAFSGTDLVLSWQTITGRNYCVENATNLGGAGAWSKVPDAAYTNLAGTGSNMQYTNRSTFPSQCFRVRCWMFP